MLLISIIFVCEINLKSVRTITILLITNAISMYSKKRYVFLLLFYFFQFAFLYANASYNLRKLSNQDGLSNSAVLCIHQDRNGFMWFGTYDGLNFYDGKNFQLFRMEYGNKYSLSSNIIHKITDAGGDNLWVCTYLGVNKFSISQHRVTENYKQYRDPCSIASNKDGLTWLIGKKNYISYYDRNNHCFRELYLPGINPEDIEAFFMDNRNLLWIFSSKQGVWNIHTNYPKENDNKKIRLIKKNAFIHNLTIQNAYYDKGLIYFVDIHGMLFVYNISHKHKVFIKNISHLLRRYGSLSSIISNHGDFLIAFKGKGTIKLVAQQHYSEEVVDLNTGVFNLYKDNNQDIVWIGTDGQGVGLYYKNQDFFNSIMLDWLPIKIAKPVRSIFTDKYNSLWFGTKGDGIIRIPNYEKAQKDKVFLQKISHFTTETGLSNDQVFALVGSKYKNILWVATNGPELSYYSYSDNRVHPVINKTKTGINYVHSLYEENDSTLWLATDGNGLIKLIINGNAPVIKVKSAKSFLFKKGSKIASELFSMLDSVFAVPPVFDDSYYGGVIHEIREMQIMNMGNYAHGNQPIQHMIYMYDYAGQPWKAQYWLREVMNRMYTCSADGYCGDEDNGQTSAWYVFSALGFYPVCPGSNEYVLGAPLFKKATITFENGKEMIINAPDNSSDNRYIESMMFNGDTYTKNYLKHSDLINGGEINIRMGNTPNKERGINKEDFPYSFSVNEKK